MRTLKFGLLLILMSIAHLCLSQYEPGRIISIGFGSGNSEHAGTYFVEEDFRVNEYSGFRALIFEAKLGWNFWEMTSIYGVGRFAPANSIISPYRSTYLGVGVSQAFPFFKRLYAIGNYGKYRSRLKNGVRSGSGNLLNIGGGFRLDDNIFVELNKTYGDLNDIDDRINIIDTENQWFATLSFTF